MYGYALAKFQSNNIFCLFIDWYGNNTIVIACHVYITGQSPCEFYQPWQNCVIITQHRSNSCNNSSPPSVNRLSISYNWNNNYRKCKIEFVLDFAVVLLIMS